MASNWILNGTEFPFGRIPLRRLLGNVNRSIAPRTGSAVLSVESESRSCRPKVRKWDSRDGQHREAMIVRGWRKPIAMRHHFRLGVAKTIHLSGKALASAVGRMPTSGGRAPRRTVDTGQDRDSTGGGEAANASRDAEPRRSPSAGPERDGDGSAGVEAIAPPVGHKCEYHAFPSSPYFPQTAATLYPPPVFHPWTTTSRKLFPFQ